MRRNFARSPRMRSLPLAARPVPACPPGQPLPTSAAPDPHLQVAGNVLARHAVHIHHGEDVFRDGLLQTLVRQEIGGEGRW